MSMGSQYLLGVKHIPTGLVVHCATTRSLTENIILAKAQLHATLQEQSDKKVMKENQQLYASSLQDASLSNRIRTYNFPQDRITDHRLGDSVYGFLSAFGSSDLPFVVAWHETMYQHDAQIKAETVCGFEYEPYHVSSMRDDQILN
eukprot:gene3581-2196_t